MSGWPWPLDAVQGWFDGLWKWIGDAASGAVSVVSGWINDAVSGLRTWVTGSVGWVWDQVKPVFGPLADWAGSVVKSFWEGLQAFVKDPVGFLGAAISSITTTIGQELTDIGAWLYSQISGALAAAGDALSTIGSTISKTLGDAAAVLSKTLGDLGSFVSTTIWGWVDGALRWASDSFKWLNDQLSLVGSNIINAVGAAIGGVGEAVSSGISAVFGPVIEDASSFFNVLGSLATAFDPSKILSDVMATIQRLMATVTMAFSAHSPRTPAEANTVAWDVVTQVSAAYLTQSVSMIIAEAASVGQVDVTLQGLSRTPQLEAGLKMVQDIYSTITDISVLTPLRQFYNQAFTPVLPGPGDLIRFVVREVITPARFAETMPLHGYSPEWANAYWEAHWVLPSPRDLYDAFHRNIITTEELDKFVVWHDFSPLPRPGLSKSDLEIMRGLLKTLIPRVDLRYAWESGSITDEELVERYRKLGYEDDSELMAEIQKGRAMVEEVTKVRTEWLSDFIGGYIDEDTLKANLAAIGTGPARIDYYVVYAKMRRERTAKKDLLGIYEDGYVKDLLTDEDLEARASELLVDDDARDIYLQKAYVIKYKKPAPPKAPTVDKAVEELRKYQISYAVEAFRKYAIEKPELIEHLVAADVDPLVAATRADYEELKRPLPKPASAEITRTKETLRVQGLGEKTAVEEFRDETIDASELFSRLEELGYSNALASAITQFEVVKAYKPGVAA